MSQWENLLDQSVSIIDQANSHFKLLDSWSFGGGTALMLQIDHRESFVTVASIPHFQRFSARA